MVASLREPFAASGTTGLLWRGSSAGLPYQGCGSRLRISSMLIPPLQPCPACGQNSVRLFDDEEKIPLPSLLQQRDECREPLGDTHSTPGGTLSTWDRATLENGFVGPALGSTGPIGEDNKLMEGHWRPGRFLLSLCTACGFARLSVRGRLVNNESSSEGGALSNDERNEGTRRLLVVHHDVLHRAEVASTGGEKDSPNGDNRRPCMPKRSLDQQSVSPMVSPAEDLLREENYAPAEWTYFVGGVEVCREAFQKHLNQVYAARASWLRDRLDNSLRAAFDLRSSIPPMPPTYAIGAQNKTVQPGGETARN